MDDDIKLPQNGDVAFVPVEIVSGDGFVTLIFPKELLVYSQDGNKVAISFPTESVGTIADVLRLASKLEAEIPEATLLN